MNGSALSPAELLRWVEPGVGFLPAPGFQYGPDYWAEYRRRDIGWRLTHARVNLVLRHHVRTCVDVGIGGGAFVEALGCQGTDINPDALDWLRDRGELWDGRQRVEAMTFWDSLEHIYDPAELLLKCKRYAFVSAPIYSDESSVTLSKHFKPGEHIWYWTHHGIQSFMDRFGFRLSKHNTMESDLGREGIGTYVFERVSGQL